MEIFRKRHAVAKMQEVAKNACIESDENVFGVEDGSVQKARRGICCGYWGHDRTLPKAMMGSRSSMRICLPQP